MPVEDKVFAALSDPNRRRIIEILHHNNSTLLKLKEDFAMSFQALSKHIKILESAELVIKEKQGKFRILSLNRETLKSALEWISYYSSFWNESFDKLNARINPELQSGND